MIWIDFVILGVISMAVLKGLFQGITQEIFSITAWLSAFLIALNFSLEFSVFLDTTIGTLTRMFVAFASMLVITLIFGGLIGLLLGEWVKKTELTVMDRMGGMVLGVVHGLIVVTAMIVLSGLTALPTELWWQESKLLPSLQLFSIWLTDTIPSDMAEYIHYR